MPLQIRPLLSTHFPEPDVRDLHIPGRIPEERRHGQWEAVVDDRNRILLTQLVGSSSEMRDGIYYYLLAVTRRLYLLEFGPGSLRVVREALDGRYPSTEPELSEHQVLSVAKDGIRMLFEYNSKAPSPPSIVGADGRPIRSPRGDV